MQEKDLQRLEEEVVKKTSSKEKVVPYLGIWLKNHAGNLPAIILHPEIMEETKKLIEQQWPDQFICGTIQIPERPLITRSTLKGIQGFVATLLEQVAKASDPE